MGPGIEPASSWIPVRVVTTEPQWELQKKCFFLFHSLFVFSLLSVIPCLQAPSARLQSTRIFQRGALYTSGFYGYHQGTFPTACPLAPLGGLALETRGSCPSGSLGTVTIGEQFLAGYYPRALHRGLKPTPQPFCGRCLFANSGSLVLGWASDLYTPKGYGGALREHRLGVNFVPSLCLITVYQYLPERSL